ncbi:triacylglycerol lipase [Pseudomonas duriflava]|uniref:Triacylglycerol lipase n=1 Tax=Pseudomonas duriflava TaxID=459528 RepID=A0A562QDJ9_9PSED|nr:triacylglycerol lipase [Pseudomonas duriflava]TWI54845.1 triacylglycerol lipase [Pseudomonas duriflava]
MTDLPSLTRYPLVLVHGLLGFVRIAGYPYWYGITGALEAAGAQVYPVRLSGAQANEVLGEQLLQEIERICTLSGAERVNLIGHSQGALSARYAAAVCPERVASVTSVAGPNHGSELADILQYSMRTSSLRAQLAVEYVQCMAKFMAFLDRSNRCPQNALASQEALTTAGMAVFNSKYPQGLPSTWGGMGDAEVNGVRYYSWSGIIDGHFSGRGANRLDPTHSICLRFSQAFTREAEQNDGFVGRFSSHLGTVIRSDYPLDHLDIINQLAGVVGHGTDPVGLYVNHALRLKEAGL